MGVSSDAELWGVYERYQEAPAIIAAESMRTSFDNTISPYLWFVSELANLSHHNPSDAQLMHEWYATYAARQQGYVGEMERIYEGLRAMDIARFQCDASEVHEELMGVSLSLHRRWRVGGYPEDFIEKQLRAVCNVLHVPFEFATPAIVEVLSYREDNPSHIAELGGSSDAA